MTPNDFAYNEFRAATVLETLAEGEANMSYRRILLELAKGEWQQYAFWKKLATHQTYQVKAYKIRFFQLMRRIFGFTFTIKLLEYRENAMIAAYRTYRDSLEDTNLQKQIDQLIEQELAEEKKLHEAIEENRVKFMSSIVLGLNDGLIELTGALTGFTFALQGTRLIALAGLITGISASLSMAASSYAQARYEDGKDPKLAAMYTGVTYLLVVLLLVAPFLVLSQPIGAMFAMLGVALCIIAGVSAYSAILYGRSFAAQFWEMALISLGVAAVAFMIGSLLRVLFGMTV